MKFNWKQKPLPIRDESKNQILVVKDKNYGFDIFFSKLTNFQKESMQDEVEKDIENGNKPTLYNWINDNSGIEMYENVDFWDIINLDEIDSNLHKKFWANNMTGRE